VHGDHLRQTEQSARCGTVDCHCELVAVNGVDLLLAQKPHETLKACRIKCSPNVKNFRRYARAPEEIAEPSNSIRRTDGHNAVAAFP
jgi:hypothetical protein